MQRLNMYFLQHMAPSANLGCLIHRATRAEPAKCRNAVVSHACTGIGCLVRGGLQRSGGFACGGKQGATPQQLRTCETPAVSGARRLQKALALFEQPTFGQI